ncbi:eukaryotic translation initiation factor 2A-like [Mesocricetus auratus]|uniref:Eukaryotic translation initiation factor 2A-like n=1 Tax=Mesocricetus auratus TaxID=10036 RepID=A0ABM2YGT0_MESAU|nr:eukaryotic translation initiation factor 2A-like [Mesocricetus auratus]
MMYQAVPSEVPREEPKPATAYRPPALRNKPVTDSKLHEDEPPQNIKPHPGSDKPLSKTALKNERKHEAKRAAKQEARSDLAPTPVPQSEPRNTITQSASGDLEVDKKKKRKKKNLKKKLLKEQAASGKQLEKNQLEKIQKETALLQELEDLELGI